MCVFVWHTDLEASRVKTAASDHMTEGIPALLWQIFTKRQKMRQAAA